MFGVYKIKEKHYIVGLDVCRAIGQGPVNLYRTFTKISEAYDNGVITLLKPSTNHGPRSFGYSEEAIIGILEYLKSLMDITTAIKEIKKAFEEAKAKDKDSDPDSDPDPDPGAIIKEVLEASKVLGVPEETARKIAIKKVKTEIGIDYTGLLGHKTVEPIEEERCSVEPATKPAPKKPKSPKAPKRTAWMIPTKLGRLVGVSPQKVNNVLYSLGYQIFINNRWMPTSKAVNGKDYMPVSRPRLGFIRTIRWNKEFFLKAWETFHGVKP
jgi:hypothetical protein